MEKIFKIETVKLSGDKKAVVIIDQTALPAKIEYLRLATAEEIWSAISRLKVRGAPAIGVTAALGIYVCASGVSVKNYNEFSHEFYRLKNYLATSRPTAVNLFWALDRMEKALTRARGLSLDEIKAALLYEAEKIMEEDIQMCRAIGEHGVSLIKDGGGILTYCNAGALAASMYGTALAPVYAAAERGAALKVYCCETRPILQGARLTAFELSRNNIDTTLICDNMVSSVMRDGLIDMVFVGADRIAANGDTANKIGTSGVAIAAKYYGVPFYVCAPSSTIDMAIKTGAGIHIELRGADEVTTMWYKERMAPERINVHNPAFDITDQRLITAIITEKGVTKPGRLC